MDVILAFVLWEITVFCLQDIVIFPKFSADHTEQARCVLSILFEAGLILKLKKCKFFAMAIDYLGYVIQHGWLTFAEHMAIAVTRLEHRST